jgi:hypothetical protein
VSEKPAYIIVYAMEPEELEIVVNRKINIGYMPVGGICIGVKTGRLYQAMVIPQKLSVKDPTAL